MKTGSLVLAFHVAILGLASVLLAQEKSREVSLKGSILCAHCALKEGTECKTAIQVKEGDKTVTYYLDDKGPGESYHGTICGGERKDGTVVGVIREASGKKFIKPSKVEYANK